MLSQYQNRMLGFGGSTIAMTIVVIVLQVAHATGWPIGVAVLIYVAAGIPQIIRAYRSLATAARQAAEAVATSPRAHVPLRHTHQFDTWAATSEHSRLRGNYAPPP